MSTPHNENDQQDNNTTPKPKEFKRRHKRHAQHDRWAFLMEQGQVLNVDSITEDGKVTVDTIDGVAHAVNSLAKDTYSLQKENSELKVTLKDLQNKFTALWNKVNLQEQSQPRTAKRRQNAVSTNSFEALEECS